MYVPAGFSGMYVERFPKAEWITRKPILPGERELEEKQQVKKCQAEGFRKGHKIKE